MQVVATDRAVLSCRRHRTNAPLAAAQKATEVVQANCTGRVQTAVALNQHQLHHTCEALEGRVTNQHLKDQDSQGPVVGSTRCAAAHDDLRRL